MLAPLRQDWALTSTWTAAVGARQQQVTDRAGDAAVDVAEGMHSQKQQLCDPRFDDERLCGRYLNPLEQ